MYSVNDIFVVNLSACDDVVLNKIYDFCTCFVHLSVQHLFSYSDWDGVGWVSVVL